MKGGCRDLSRSNTNMDNDIFIYPAERDWAGNSTASGTSRAAGEKRPAPIPRPEPVEPVRPEPIPRPEPVEPVRPEPIPRPEPVEPVRPAPIPRPEPVEPVRPEPIPRPEPVEPVRPEPIPRPEPVEPVRPAPIPRPYPTESAFPLPLPIPAAVKVRFLNAAFGYGVLRVAVGRKIMATYLSYGTVSSFSRIASGYQTVTVTNQEGYVYLQKTIPFQMNTISTVAVIRTSSGLDLLPIPECGCRPSSGYADFRVSNLAYGSAPMDVILSDGRVIYSDVQYKETTSFKRMRPGSYQFFFAETSLVPMPRSEDIESIDEGFSKFYPPADILASLFVEAEAGYTYTALLLNGPRGSLQAMLLAEK